MSSDIWTRFEAESRIAPLAFRAFRSVEDQYTSSTYKLVDSPAEHDVLEGILEDTKPKVTEIDGVQGMHYLLFTPFRYPPLKYGSRFGTPAERGIFYGSLRAQTALAEAAYYRYRFTEDCEAFLFPLRFEMTVFSVRVSTGAGLDWTAPFFLDCRDIIADPLHYSASQQIGSRMREAQVEAFLFPSARCPNNGSNAGVFTPRAFKQKTIVQKDLKQWMAVVYPETAVFIYGVRGAENRYTFDRSAFLVDGQLPIPN